MNIGLLGHGTIGVGVDRIIKNLDGYQVTKILSLVIDSEMEGRTATDIHDIAKDPEIDTVVEVMGGVEPAYSFLKECMENGKNVVTANKAVVAAHFDDLISLSKKYQVSFRATASVGGGIPWLVNLERAKRVDEILEVGGILNGTTNFMMNSMTQDGTDFDTILKKAQELGYAEKDPSADIDGLDIRRKINISANVAYNVFIEEESIPAFGIRSVTSEDVQNAKEMKRTIKLLASSGKTEDGKLFAYVEPTMLSSDSLPANVMSNYNLAYFRGKYTGTECFTGQGAGRYPTAYNVVEDIVDIQTSRPDFYITEYEKSNIDNSGIFHTYYVRARMESEFLKENTEEVRDGYILTKPVSVEAMHAFAKEAREKDASLFFAAVERS